jgi:hypothetical protein
MGTVDLDRINTDGGNANAAGIEIAEPLLETP